MTHATFKAVTMGSLTATECGKEPLSGIFAIICHWEVKQETFIIIRKTSMQLPGELIMRLKIDT